MNLDDKYSAQIARVRSGLVKVETALRATDQADDAIGEHAGKMHRRVSAAIEAESRGMSPGGNDPDKEARLLWMVGHQHRAAQAKLMAERLQRRR